MSLLHLCACHILVICIQLGDDIQYTVKCPPGELCFMLKGMIPQMQGANNKTKPTSMYYNTLCYTYEAICIYGDLWSSNIVTQGIYSSSLILLSRIDFARKITARICAEEQR